MCHLKLVQASPQHDLLVDGTRLLFPKGGINPIQIWPYCWFHVLSAARVKYQTLFKSRGRCTTLRCSRNRWSCTNEQNIASDQIHITYENETTPCVWTSWFHTCTWTLGRNNAIRHFYPINIDNLLRQIAKKSTIFHELPPNLFYDTRCLNC